MHVENEVIIRRNKRIFDFHFCFGDMNDFVSSYFTLNNAIAQSTTISMAEGVN